MLSLVCDHSLEVLHWMSLRIVQEYHRLHTEGHIETHTDDLRVNILSFYRGRDIDPIPIIVMFVVDFSNSKTTSRYSRHASYFRLHARQHASSSSYISNMTGSARSKPEAVSLPRRHPRRGPNVWQASAAFPFPRRGT